MEKQSYRLSNKEVRHRAARAVLDAPDYWTVDINPPKRSREQGAHFHALCSDISKSGLVWDGRARTPEEWKILLISGHAVATGGAAELVRGVEGELVNIRESTAKMLSSRASSLIEYVIAFCSAHEVKMKNAEQYSEF